MTNEEQIARDRKHQRWLVAPVIACIVAAGILLLLLIPGVLMYPEDVAALPTKEKILLEESNKAMRQRIASLKKALDLDVCVADGMFTTPNGVLPSDVIDALPGPPLSKSWPSRQAVKELESFDGSMADLVDRATVFIRVPAAANKVSMGSGVFVSSDLILTNAHVVEGASTKNVSVYNDVIGSLDAAIIAVGQSSGAGEIDLAILKVNAPPKNSIYLTMAAAKQGQTVTAAGFPWVVMGQDPRFTKWLEDPLAPDPKKKPFIDTQILNLVQVERDDVEWLYHTASIDKGNSGGPLVDDCGFLIGINTGAISRDSDSEGKNEAKTLFYKAIGKSTIEKFVDKNGLPKLQSQNSSCTSAERK